MPRSGAERMVSRLDFPPNSVEEKEQRAEPRIHLVRMSQLAITSPNLPGVLQTFKVPSLLFLPLNFTTFSVPEVSDPLFIDETTEAHRKNVTSLRSHS